MALEIAWPWVAAAAPLPLLVFLLLPRGQLRSDAALRVPFYAAVADTQSGARGSTRWLALLLALLAWAALIAAAVRPQLIGEPLSLPVSGRDMILAVDISGSMDTEDMVLSDRPVTRLRAVKAVAGEFIERREGDRLGLILFGRRAYLQTPLTFDRPTTRQLLDESAIGLAGKETAIGDAIGLAVKRLRDRPQDQRVLILLTDGANTAGEISPLKAADLAAAEGLKIYTIGVGADRMTVRSYFGGTRRINPSADLDEDTLTKIADKTGGRYFRARDTAGLVEIYSLLDELEPVEQEQEVYRPVRDLFVWPLGIALALAMAATLALRGIRQ